MCKCQYFCMINSPKCDCWGNIPTSSRLGQIPSQEAAFVLASPEASVGTGPHTLLSAGCAGLNVCVSEGNTQASVTG